MSELSLREVTQDNWREALRLAVLPEQQRFISDYVPIAAIGLAKAYIRPGGLIWVPYVFYDKSTIIGFTELAYEHGSEENYWIFHFFIDQHYQGQGYGKKALQQLLHFIRDQHAQCRSIQLTVHPENESARLLYTQVGFQTTGIEFSGEPIYKLILES